MNSFIIAMIHKSRLLNATFPTNQDQSHCKAKKFEKQTYVILFLVTFGFLVLVTPSYLCLLYTNLVEYRRSAKSFAEFYFFYHVAQKLFFTNYGINFYLYVISGQKFRRDLISLLHLKTNLHTKNINSSKIKVTVVMSTEWPQLVVHFTGVCLLVILSRGG